MMCKKNLINKSSDDLRMWAEAVPLEDPSLKATILIVEDDAILAMNLRRIISLLGYIVAGPFVSGEKAIAFLSGNSVDLVLMDIDLAGSVTGITAAEEINLTLDVPIVFLTGFSHELLLEQSKIAAPYGYLIKPVPEQELAATLKIALHRHKLDRDLKESKNALEISEAKYRHLFENSPLGIFRTSLDGEALTVNAEMANIFGCDTPEEVLRDFTDLANQFYVDPNRRQEFITELKEKGVVNHFEYEGRKKKGRNVWIAMNAKLTPSEELNEQAGERVIDGFAIDITERKLARTFREIGIEALQILNGPGELRESVQRVLAVLKNRTGIYAVAIRLQEGDDYPYFAREGFPDDFILRENSLVSNTAENSICRDESGRVVLDCTCGLVISGKTDPSQPIFTQGGSFWINDSFPLLEIPLNEDLRKNPRNQCIHRGYTSFALIPIRNKDEIVGLIQLNDRRKDRFTLGMVELLEGIASHIGEALLRKQTEETLRESEGKHRVLVKNLPDIVMRFDREGRHLFVSENVTDVFVLKAEHFIGKNHHELGFPEYLCNSWSESIRKVFESGLPSESELSFEGKQGAVIHNWRLVPEMNSKGQVKSVLTISRDITAHRLAEQNYKTLFHEMLDGFALHEIICNHTGIPINYRFLSVNPAFERMTGLKAADIVGRTVLEVLPNTEQYWIEAYGRVALSGEQFHFENYSSELQKHFEVSSFQFAPNKFACIFTDITERKHAEEEKESLHAQLFQAQKMEAIGTLAGGIAHDFNNILSAIMGYAEITSQLIPPGSAAIGHLGKVMKASQRAASLVKQILSFSRQTNIDRIPLVPSQIVKEVVKLLRPSLPSTIIIKQQIDTATKSILADPTQVHQILMNLCTNAFHAMEQTGGILEIMLNNHDLSAADLWQNPDVLPGTFAMLSVCDTGPGIDMEIRDRIFDPYFTTKKFGKGTGMGLAIAHGIVTSYGGFINCESEIGKGTIFRVFFPVIDEGVAPEINSVCVVPSGTEHILFVDDETMLADLGKKMLERLGYKVTVNTSSLDAWNTFQDQPSLFDAVVTDQTMPNMTGIDLSRQILQLRPDIPIILCTGYSTLINEEQARAGGVKGYAMKPLTMPVLATLLRKVLDENESGIPSTHGKSSQMQPIPQESFIQKHII